MSIIEDNASWVLLRIMVACVMGIIEDNGSMRYEYY